MSLVRKLACCASPYGNLFTIMSAVDQYNHRLLGFIECPSTFDFVYQNSTRKIGVYELLEDIPVDESNFDGKTGDILVGGGKGEVPAFRISIPNAFYYFSSEEWDNFHSYDELFKAFWTPTQSYILCEGFMKIGWNVEINIEQWLAENVCKALIESIKVYSIFKIDTEDNTGKLSIILLE